MRSRSVTVYNLDDLSMEQEREHLRKLKKQMAETWQENETHIVLKMINESLKIGDHEKVKELKRSLLNLERNSSQSKSEEEQLSPENSPPQSLGKTSTRESLRELTLVREDSGQSKTDPTDFSPIESRYLEKVIMQNVKQHDLKVNIMLLGGKATGKTTLMHSLLKLKCPVPPQPTRGLDSKTGTATVAGKIIRYKIIDSDSDRSKEFIKKVYYDMSQAVVVVFDISSRKSFEEAKEWAKSVRQATTKDQTLFLIGNIKHKRAVGKEAASKYARANNMHYHEVSAVEDKGISELMTKITYYAVGAGVIKEEPPEGTEERRCTGCNVL